VSIRPEDLALALLSSLNLKHSRNTLAHKLLRVDACLTGMMCSTSLM
jgi:hypothetical protein